MKASGEKERDYWLAVADCVSNSYGHARSLLRAKQRVD